MTARWNLCAELRGLERPLFSASLEDRQIGGSVLKIGGRETLTNRFPEIQ
jgi:hypothetical protein